MSNIVSHNTFSSYEEAKNEILVRVNDKHLLSLLSDLESCSLGRFLIQHRGLDAYWTKRITENKEGGCDNSFEAKLITIPPVFIATQERSRLFIEQVNNLANNSYIISVPAGLLPEFTEVNVTSKSFKIDAYDLDSSCASKTSLSKLEQVTYFVEDIFKTNVNNKYDVVVSNGLNIYLKTNSEVELFYKIVSDNLENGGVLITSFLNNPSNVDITGIEPTNLKFAKDVFVKLLDIGWKKTHLEREFREILEACGFTIKEIIYDKNKMFPTVVALKK